MCVQNAEELLGQRRGHRNNRGLRVWKAQSGECPDVTEVCDRDVCQAQGTGSVRVMVMPCPC